MNITFLGSMWFPTKTPPSGSSSNWNKNKIKKSKNKRWYIIPFHFLGLCSLALATSRPNYPLKRFMFVCCIYPCWSDLDHQGPPPPPPPTSRCIWCSAGWGSPWRKAGWDFCSAGRVQTWKERTLEYGRKFKLNVYLPVSEFAFANERLYFGNFWGLFEVSVHSHIY